MGNGERWFCTWCETTHSDSPGHCRRFVRPWAQKRRNDWPSHFSVPRFDVAKLDPDTLDLFEKGMG